VAGFVGSPGMNFLEGNLRQSKDSWLFEMAGAQGGKALQINLDRYAFADTSITDGQPVEFGIRPENISLGENVAQMPVKQALKIDIVETMGADTIAWCALADKAFTVRADSDTRFEPDQPLLVGLDPARASIFDVSNGNRV